MSVSRPFIERPIATSLLALATILGGILGYLSLPISSLPQVDFPTVEVTTELPGASPDTMSTLVTASLERQFGQIQSLATMSSTSSFGLSRITLQFNLDRDIDAAAQDVQAAINAAGSTLPKNLPYPPVYSKVNPADTPIVTLALTSNTLSLRSLSDLADTLLAQRLSSVSGVGHVSIEGGIKPAVRVEDGRVALVGLVEDRCRGGPRDVGGHLEADGLHRRPDDRGGHGVDGWGGLDRHDKPPRREPERRWRRMMLSGVEVCHSTALSERTAAWHPSRQLVLPVRPSTQPISSPPAAR